MKLQEAITLLYHKFFNDSKIEVKQALLFSRPFIDVQCYLSRDKTELKSKLWHNDMFNIHITLDAINENEVMFTYLSKSYIIKNGCRKIAKQSRIIKRDEISILKEVDSMFKKIHDSLIEDIKNDNIEEDYIELLNKRIIL